MGAGRLESFQHCRTLEDKSLGTKIFLKKRGRRAVTILPTKPLLLILASQAGDRPRRQATGRPGLFFLLFLKKNNNNFLIF